MMRFLLTGEVLRGVILLISVSPDFKIRAGNELGVSNSIAFRVVTHLIAQRSTIDRLEKTGSMIRQKTIVNRLK